MQRVAWFITICLLCLAGVGPVLADTAYVVQAGDTLYRIAVQFGVTVPALIAANNLANPNLIYAGQILNIPGPAGDPPAPPAANQQYVVQPGDTLFQISMRFGTTVPGLMAANHLNSTIIYVSQVLLIPGGGAAATPVPPPPLATATAPAAATPCGLSWFFSNPPANACPAALPLVTQAAAERFEHGLMLWLRQPDTFYVFEAGPAGQASPLIIVTGPIQIAAGGSLNNRVGGAPPGLFEPVSGFGLLWRGETTGNLPPLRTVLGWATEAEHPIETSRQCQAYPGTGYPSLNCFLRGPSREILNIYYVQYFGNFWQLWP